MNINISNEYGLCPTIRRGKSGSWHRKLERVKGPPVPGWVLLAMAVMLLLPVAAMCEEGDHGGGGGGGGGCGDVFGDLIHILRHDMTGQPIFAQRWVEAPKGVEGFTWGYCPVAVDEDGQELPFVPYSCDVDPDYADLAIAVDYFGRLNGGRTKERNNRMHFDEVISNIKAAGRLKVDPTGRLTMGYECVEFGDCLWTTVDSPMESMALYSRLMKYGHLATDPYEINTWAHGDPKQSTQFHPALDEVDWQKFLDAGLDNLLPSEKAKKCWDYTVFEDFDDDDGDGFWNPAEPFMDIDGDGIYNPDHPRPEPFTDLNGNDEWDPAEPFIDLNDNGIADEFAFLCANPESLDNDDFGSASVYVGAAANKTRKITVDLIQYFNRILKITQTTKATQATLDTLPALYRDCWKSKSDPVDPLENSVWTDPVYDEVCHDKVADPSIPGWDYFPHVQELFMDFAHSKYSRSDRADATADVILESSPGLWGLSSSTSLAEWVVIPNPETPDSKNIHNFVGAASDALRSIEYIHNYAVPDDLYCIYDVSYCQ
jgi:hypothetical protein